MPNKADSQAKPGLENFSVTVFPAVLGIVGLGLAWRDAGAGFGIPGWIGEIIAGFGAGFFAAVLALYGLKIFRFPNAAVKEATSVPTASLVAAIPMNFMLVAGVIAPYVATLGEMLWWIGVIGQLAVTIHVVGYVWLNKGLGVQSITPVWLLPTVGIILAPISGSAFDYPFISWLLFGIAVFFWVALTPLLLYRLVFAEGLAPPQRPALVIILTPPSLCVAAYVHLQGGYMDPFAHMLFGVACMMALLLLTKLKEFMALPFSMAWWAFTFPLDAFARATMLYNDHLEEAASAVLALLALGVATLVVSLVFWRTVRFMFQGGLFRPPG
ncbi:hypothetical protein [Hwanghaeella sp.]|uniref:SLAC1 family transporter n=1 Tax=Hwanghaeella sp. TaxID=2605943 RepID=UPI003CCB76CB